MFGFGKKPIDERAKELLAKARQEKQAAADVAKTAQARAVEEAKVQKAADKEFDKAVKRNFGSFEPGRYPPKILHGAIVRSGLRTAACLVAVTTPEQGPVRNRVVTSFTGGHNEAVYGEVLSLDSGRWLPGEINGHIERLGSIVGRCNLGFRLVTSDKRTSEWLRREPKCGRHCLRAVFETQPPDVDLRNAIDGFLGMLVEAEWMIPARWSDLATQAHRWREGQLISAELLALVCAIRDSRKQQVRIYNSVTGREVTPGHGKRWFER